MIIATAIIKFDPSNTEEILSEAAKIVEYSKGEPGCLRSYIAQQVGQEGQLLGLQVFEDMTTFEQHAASSKSDPAYTRWGELVTGLDGTVYEGAPVDIGHIVNG